MATGYDLIWVAVPLFSLFSGGRKCKIVHEVYGLKKVKREKILKFKLYLTRIFYALFAVGLLVSVLTGIFSYVQEESQQKKRFFSDRGRVLTQSRMQIDARLMQLDAQMVTILSANELNTLMNASQVTVQEDYKELLKIQQLLRSITADSLVDASYLTFYRSEVVLSSQGIYSAEGFPEKEAAAEVLKYQKTSRQGYFETADRRLLHYQTLPLEYLRKLGALVISIDFENVYFDAVNDMVSVASSESFEALKMGQEEQHAEVQSFNAEDGTIYIYQRSPYSGLYYYLTEDAGALSQIRGQALSYGLRQGGGLFCLIFIPAFLLFVLFSLVLNNIRGILSRRERGCVPFLLRDKNVNAFADDLQSLIKAQNSLEQEVGRLAPLAMQEVLRGMLLSTHPVSPSFVELMEDKFGRVGSHYIVLAVKLYYQDAPSTEVLEAVRQEFLEMLQRQSASLTITINQYRIAAVTWMEEQEVQLPMEHILASCRDWVSVNRENPVDLSIGTSGVFAEIGRMGEAYEQAQTASQRAMLYGRNRLFCFGEKDDSAKLFEIAKLQKFETNFYAALTAGDSEGGSAAVAAIIQDISQQHKENEMMLYLKYSIIVTLSRYAAQFNMELEEALSPREIDAVFEAGSQEAICDQVRTIMDQVAAALEIRNNQKGKKKIEKMCLYIRENYDRDLSVAEVAEHVGLSVNHANHVFKESMGMPILQYLTQHRMNVARALLEETDKTVQEIAGSVGYNDVKSLIRFFKKFYGMTPGEYRENSRSRPRE